MPKPIDKPQVDPNAQFLGQQSSVGNNAGLDLALYRLIRWLMNRRKPADPGQP
jgi:hypothetical protein